jgi:hypothetical protein
MREYQRIDSMMKLLNSIQFDEFIRAYR